MIRWTEPSYTFNCWNTKTPPTVRSFILHIGSPSILLNFNTFKAMWPIGGPRYILRRNYRKTLSFAFFLGTRINAICHLLCLRYFLSPLFHNMMLLIKTFKTKKFITVRTESFWFLFFIQMSNISRRDTNATEKSRNFVPLSRT